jgi:hypothetical protein
MKFLSRVAEVKEVLALFAPGANVPSSIHSSSAGSPLCRGAVSVDQAFHPGALSSEPLFLGHEGATRTIVPQLQEIVTTITGPTLIRVCHPLIRPGIELRLRLGDHIIACKQLPYMDEGVCLCTDLATHVDTLRPPRGRDQAPHTSPPKL